MTTNVLPELTTWEYDALKDSIRRWRVILPVVMDEKGDIIDGYQRVRACAELGITDYPVLTLAGLSDEEKRDHAYVLNLVRRRLNQQQMRDLIAAELRRTPDLSDNWLAQILGTTDKTVKGVRDHLISTSEIPKLDALRGKDGKYRRVTRIVTSTAKEAERAQQALKILGDNTPDRCLELRLAERRVRRRQRAEAIRGRAVRPPGDGAIRLLHCPFQEVEEVAGIALGSVDLILTDPPYGRDFLPQLADLAELAGRILAPGGLFVCYYGHYYLDRAMATLGERLVFRWMAATVWETVANEVFPLQVFSRWRPVLIYTKGEWVERKWWYDMYVWNCKEKEVHEWQQPIVDVERLLSDFSQPGDLVVDPCGGGFTTALACVRLGRRCISCDIEEAAVIRGQDRIAEATQEEVGS